MGMINFLYQSMNGGKIVGDVFRTDSSLIMREASNLNFLGEPANGEELDLIMVVLAPLVRPSLNG